MGCLILVVYGAQRLWERLDARLRRPFLLLTIVLLAAGCLKTIARNQDWSSREALLRYATQLPFPPLPGEPKNQLNASNMLLRSPFSAGRAWKRYRTTPKCTTISATSCGTRPGPSRRSLIIGRRCGCGRRTPVRTTTSARWCRSSPRPSITSGRLSNMHPSTLTRTTI